ncbi:GrpB family protein [Planomicrobium sp. CPCC 101079]|uniref:GrpB family protein n=1 Tax=Planomicrobium sp. CPCC 101079 TaxID=2599618 RepID=UPI0011B44A9C|nr:GrpB family protein [Planomicrobium sp. CPCC 101079]TWT09188.1 GrpB family protein [Planomicrobium sp. CPCC 101079]
MKVRLTEYDKNWVRMFEQESGRLKEVFGDEILRFEHFGSTSVPGMKAKPVVDMMCLVKEIGKIDAFNERMLCLGYDVAGDWGIEGRRLFRKGGDNRSHHIHFYQFDHSQIERHLVFRDYLRSHPEEAERYGQLKEELAGRHDDTGYYSKAKKAFVQDMEQRALRWFDERQRALKN